jgi:acyl-CoA thioester hydrolase
VYYEDTDAGGIMYHAGYLRFAERARTEWLRALGVNQQELREATGLGFVVTKLSIEYILPAKLDDELVTTTAIAELGRASILLRQEVWRNETLIAGLDVRIACITAAGQVARLPEALYNKLKP